jgi:3-methyladenine DNA glycosylase Tag
MNIRPGNYYAAGCHYLFDNEKETFTVRFPDFNAEKAAAQTEQACQDHLKEKGL